MLSIINYSSCKTMISSIKYTCFNAVLIQTCFKEAVTMLEFAVQCQKWFSHCNNPSKRVRVIQIKTVIWCCLYFIPWIFPRPGQK